jgi:hypothetical protein
MYAKSSGGSGEDRRPPYSGELPERAPLQAAFKAAGRVKDRALFIIGVVSLLVLVPMLWFWIAYGSVLSPALVWVGGIGLSLLAAGIGLALIRILDDVR